jgi:serine/threonine-protein kinase
MELLEGRSLEALRQASGGALPVADVLRHVAAVLEVLEHTHALRVVHRDLKPSNVFVTRDGHTRVLDFGIASAGDAPAQADASITATRGILGTPAYMAPEQARGRWSEVDHRTDLWAVGATMFTLLTGELVHVAVTENERLGQAMARRARSLSSVRPDLGGALVELVDRSLSYEREARFQSAADFREAVARVAARPREPRAFVRDATPTVADATSSPRARRLGRPGIVLFAGAAVLFAGTVVAYRAATALPAGALSPARTATKPATPKPAEPRSDVTEALAPQGAPRAEDVSARSGSSPTVPSAGGAIRPGARALDGPPRARPRPDERVTRSVPPLDNAATKVLSGPERDDLDARTPAGSVAYSPDDLMDRRD